MKRNVQVHFVTPALLIHCYPLMLVVAEIHGELLAIDYTSSFLLSSCARTFGIQSISVNVFFDS